MVQVLRTLRPVLRCICRLDLVAMSPLRVTATSSFWRAQSPTDVEQDNAVGNFPSRFARPPPVNTKIPLDNIAKSAAEHVSAWLRKHGKVGGTLCPLFQVKTSASAGLTLTSSCRPSNQNFQLSRLSRRNSVSGVHYAPSCTLRKVVVYLCNY